jgi:hypothetical protein
MSEDAHFHLPRHESLPPLDIEAAISIPDTSTGRRELSELSAANSCWTSTTLEKSVELTVVGELVTAVGSNSAEQNFIYTAKNNTEKEFLPQSSQASSTKANSTTNTTPPTVPDEQILGSSLSTARKVALVTVACLAQFLNLSGMSMSPPNSICPSF